MSVDPHTQARPSAFTNLRRELYKTKRRVRRRFKNLGIDTFIIAHPKHGKTWLRVMLGKALCAQHGLADSYVLEETKLAKAAGLPAIMVGNDFSSAADNVPYQKVRWDDTYDGKSVLFLARDVKDVMVSFYFHCAQRMRPINRYHGTIGEFVRDDYHGIRKLLTFYNVWHDNRARLGDFRLIRYEDMHRDPAAELRRALELVGAGDVPDAAIVSAVEFGSFENMKQLERQNYFAKSSAMRTRNAGNEQTFKVRKGKVGGFKEELSDEDIRYIDEVVAELGNPFA